MKSRAFTVARCNTQTRLAVTDMALTLTYLEHGAERTVEASPSDTVGDVLLSSPATKRSLVLMNGESCSAGGALVVAQRERWINRSCCTDESYYTCTLPSPHLLSDSHGLPQRVTTAVTTTSPADSPACR